jgi:hypothetical protein
VVEMLAGGGLAILGVVVGRFLPARRRHPKPSRPAKPVCGCEHELSFHDPKTGECHSKMLIPGYGWNNDCTCRQYTGPEPLPEYYAPELPS